MQKNLGITLLLVFSISNLLGQEEVSKKKEGNKGRIYFFWGWNQSWYGNSDISFDGSNYHFTLDDMAATDRQTPFSFNDYFAPERISLPQTNFRIGYFINDKMDISVGVDHMKYVLVYNQETKITGYIHDLTIYDGNYFGDDFINTYSFLKFEHTDGLNYINVEVNRNESLLDALKLKYNANKLQLNGIVGLGAGILLPKSNVNLWNNQRHDDFHLSGYGLSVGAGLDLILYKYFFIRGQYKFGYINMPDIRTSDDPSDRASQAFVFNELFFSVGATFHLIK